MSRTPVALFDGLTLQQLAEKTGVRYARRLPP
jgi:hypothetical protein